MKRYILLIMIILLSFSVLGVTENLDNVYLTEDWAYYNYNARQDGNADTLITDFSAITETITSSTGTIADIKLVDIDKDGVTELISATNTIIYAQNVTNGAINIEGGYAHGGVNVTNGFSIMSSGFVSMNRSYDQIVMIINKSIILNLEFNGTSFIEVQTYENSSIFTDADTGIICNDDSTCYFGTNTCDIVAYDLLTNTATKTSITGGVDCFRDYTTTSGSSGFSGMAFDHEQRPLILSDIDGDGNDELISAFDYDSNTRIGLMVFDLSTNSLDAGFNGVGYIDDISPISASTRIGGVAVGNMDGGTREIFITMGVKGGLASHPTIIKGYTSSGSNVLSYSHNSYYSLLSTDYHYASNPIIANFLSSSDKSEVCYSSHEHRYSPANNLYSLNCWDSTYAKVVNDVTGAPFPASNVNIFSTSSSIGDNGTNLLADLVSSNQVYSVESGESDSIYGSNYMTAYGDVDGDGFGDVCGVETLTDLGIMCIFGNTTNLPPTINNSYEYGGYGSSYSFESPICLNTSLTFSAEKDLNYVNDQPFDEERLTTNCGYDSNPLTDTNSGSFAPNFPSYSCVFNETGIYNVRIYLEDEANTGDRTQYNADNIQVLVIDGVAGNTCNTGIIAVGETLDADSSSNTALDSSIDDTLGILTGTSDNMKLLLAFVIIIGLVWTTASQGITNPSALGLIAILGISFVTFFGLLPTWVMITVISTIVILGILKIAVAGSGAE